MKPSSTDDAAPTTAPPTLWDDAYEHLELLRQECLEQLESGMFRVAERQACLDVALLPAAGALGGARRPVGALIDEHPRLLIVAPHGASAPTLIARTAFDAPKKRDLVPLVVPLHLLAERPLLDEATVARTSPAAGLRVVRRALDEGKLLVLVDGVSQLPLGHPAWSRARSTPSVPDPEGAWLAFVESVAAFGEAHPGAHVVVLLRQTPPSWTPHPLRVRGYSTAMLLPPVAETVLPAHRFLARRAPQRRAQLYLERARTLLRAWDPERLPPIAAIARTDIEGRMAVFRRVATHMHGRCQLDLERDDLVAFLDAEIGLGLPAEVGADTAATEAIRRAAREDGVKDSEFRASLVAAVDVVETIREYPGLMVETATGTIAFADVALQRVLAAEDMVLRGQPKILVGLRGSLWWQDVIAMAAGLMDDPAPLVDGLLRASRGHAASDTLLAAYCAESAAELPAPLRRKLDERVAEILPPRNEIHIELLLQFGETFGPALTRALATAGPKQCARSALTLGRMLHEPATPALLERITDKRMTYDVASVFHGVHLEVGGKPVAFAALLALFLLALRPSADGAAMEDAMARVAVPILVEVAYLGFLLIDHAAQHGGTLTEREIARAEELVERMRAVGKTRGSDDINWMDDDD